MASPEHQDSNDKDEVGPLRAISARSSRVIVFGAALVAALVIAWALTTGSDRDLWSDVTGFVHLMTAVPFS